MRKLSDILKGVPPTKDSVHVVGPNGPTNAELHEAILEGVDDSKARQVTYTMAKEAGASEKVLSVLAP